MPNDVKAIQITWLSKTGLTNLNSGEGGSNLIDIKKFRYNGYEFPYVSGQAMRFYLKEAIRRHLKTEEACVPNNQGENCGNIKECVLCDLFGFMRTERTNIRGEGKSHVRTSPVKVSPAMGLLPLDSTMITDFLTRHPRETVIDAATSEKARSIVNVELTVNIYKAGICIDVQRVGREEVVKIENSTPHISFEEYIKEEERCRRIRLILDAIKDFSDYSKQARLLTDFTPDLVLISLQHNYSHRLQKALELYNDGSIRLNIERLKQVIDEIKEEVIFIDNKPALWAGIVNGTLENTDEIKQSLENLKIPVLLPREAINEAKKALEIKESTS